MTLRRIVAFGAMAIGVGAIAWSVSVSLPWRQPPRRPPAPPPVPAPATPGRTITARLLYVSDDGTRLKAVEREVPYGEGAAAQAGEIVKAQLLPAGDPLVSAVPPGTTLRALYLTAGGSAFVDLSREVVKAHPGGSLDELLTVYTIVNALTMNLPAVTSVQVLVDGKEVDTLAGHVDLRRPLTENVSRVE